MPNAVNDNSGWFRPVKDHIGIGSDHDATDIALVGSASDIGVIGQ
jgi:hypothetical protein